MALPRPASRLGAVARLAALAVAVTVAGPAARAQPVPALPSLTPRVFTSTGPARVSLPAIQRQPLTGFGPPPRTYVVPAEREPVVEPFEPPVEALPPFEIAAPAEPPVSVRPRRTFRAEAAVGSQFARMGRLDIEAAGESGLFFVDADLDGLTGSADYVRSDRLTVRAGGQSYGRGRLRLDGVLTADAYSLPGTAAGERRTRFAAGTTVGMGGLGRIPYDIRAGYTQSRLGGGDAGETSEGRLDTEARIGLAANRLRLDAAGGVSGSGNGGTAGGFGDVAYASAGAALATGRADGARLVVGVRAFAVRAADAGGTNTQAVGPILDARLPLSPTLVAFAVNAPRLDVRSLATLAAINPYVATGAVVQPDVLPVDARAGVEIGRGVALVRLYGLGTFAPARLVFERASGGFYTESYVRALTAGVGADVTAGEADGASVSAGVEARYGRLEFGDFPFYAPLVARAAVSAPFASGRGRAGLTAHIESARPEDLTGQIDAPAFGLVGVDARYDVSGPFALVARAERLVGTVERWSGFPEAPFTVLLGLRLSR
ncbi:MAG TPA: hypothetical protein VF594_05285 [Rubricoccaceae bacterium]|jgi:hypothetical protein